MNILLWILQFALALQAVAGGAFKLFSLDAVAKEPWFSALPRAGWHTLGALEVLCGVLLLVPALFRWRPVLTPIGATILGVESLALAVIYAQHSTQLTASNPMVWVMLMAVMAAFIAHGRRSLRPIPGR